MRAHKRDDDDEKRGCSGVCYICNIWLTYVSEVLKGIESSSLYNKC